MRLCQKIDHPNLGIVFTGVHRYGGEPGNPAPLLRRLMPYLRQLNLSGSTHSPLDWSRTMTIEALDMGTCDNLAIVSILTRLGYTVHFGFVRWDDSGNPYHKLKRSYDALVQMIDVAERHPGWFDHLLPPQTA
ncbi:hypothetical protein D3C76_1128570 [compost metagenome]